MESGTTVLNFLFLLAGLFGYACFVLASVSILRTSRSTLREQNGWSSVRFARRVVRAADTYLLVVQIGKFFCGLFSGAIVLRLVHSYHSTFESLLFGGPSGEVAYWAYVAILFLGTTVVALTFVQFAKALGYAAPERVLSIVSVPLVFLRWVFTPLLFLLQNVVGAVLKSFALDAPVERGVVLSAEDLSEVVQKSSEAGVIEDDEREFIEGVFRLGEIALHDVMTPRKDIVSIREDDSLATVIDTFVDAGYSRLLVIGEELDDVRGMLLAKDLLPLINTPDEHFSVSRAMRKVVFIDGRRLVDDALGDLRSQSAHFAVVLDEHGGVDGLVTMEDLIEEIVGDIFDETDTPEEEIEVTETLTGELIVDGGTALDDLNDEHGLDFPEGEYSTIAGFVIHALGRIPDEGEEVRTNGSLVRVEKVEQNRILQLRILEAA
ncbi:MAG: HlyC/CorC family transporter [Bdellovibrionales bacterium]|nr:HlyC/CorC family transporter [Bdellovibrionales bacterium]